MEIIRKIYTFLLDSIQTFLIAAAIFLVIYLVLFRPFEVKGNSMYPNFYDKEYVLTNLIGFENFGFYKATFGKLKLGDVVVFKAPPEPDKDYVKRIIGVPGDSIFIRDGMLYLNDKLLDEKSFLKPSVKTYSGSFLKDDIPVTVPKDQYFVMGDNRPESSDSREWGFVRRDQIIGKSWLVYLPLNRIRLVENPFGN